MSKKTLFLVFILTILLFIGIRNFSNKRLVTIDSVGKISIHGTIMDEENLIKKLDIINKNNKLHGLIIEIDSPGGAVVPSYRIYNKIREISGKKPTAIVMKSIAASGGYLISLGGEKIFAHPSTITGSIGVIFFKADAIDFMNKIGIKPIVFKSGKLKASPNPAEKLNNDSKQMMERLILEAKKQFLNLVLESRKIIDEKIIQDIQESGIYLGSEAKKIGLIDELGGIEEAYEWIRKEKNINFPLIEINIKDKNDNNLIKKIFGLINLDIEIANNLNLLKKNGLYLIYDQ